MKVGA